MTLYLDTETTGFSPAAGDAVVEIAIVDDFGCSVINTLVNPRRSIPWQARNIHGISDEMVRGKPTLDQLLPRIHEIVAGEQVVIYRKKQFASATERARSKRSRPSAAAVSED